MQFKIQVKPDNRDDLWWEDYNKPEVVDQASAEVAGQGLVDYFNRTLRPGESPRTLLAVVLESNSVGEDHRWAKTNLITIYQRGRYFDLLECEGCGITAKRYGVASILIDPKFRAKVYRTCDSARAWLAKRQRA